MLQEMQRHLNNILQTKGRATGGYLQNYTIDAL